MEQQKVYIVIIRGAYEDKIAGVFTKKTDALDQRAACEDSEIEEHDLIN